ncbi:MAG: Rieske 2Fe-2S domain-containing protein [Dehalococcoidia bacterium]|nr:Rieske 2Fe-2S domain-containing protein [Dehalococcoidia bacterium]
MDIEPGQIRVFDCAGRSLAVSNIDGELYAIDNLCTHDGGPLGEGQLRRGRVVCPRHGATFDAKTGKVLALPAVRDVAAYAVAVEGDGFYIDCPGVAGSDDPNTVRDTEATVMADEPTDR